MKLNTPALFRAQLLVDCNGTPKPYAEVMDPFQVDDHTALDAGWQRVTGQSSAPGCRRAYLERPRGHSKTTDLAVMALYALCASQRNILGLAAAGDQDQARLLLHAADQIVRLNPWLAKLVEVQRNCIVRKRTGSRLEVLASDAPTSYGLTPDFVICDEVSHWPNHDLWDSLISASAKRSHCVVVVIANAGTGMGGSRQWDIREACRTSANWFFHRLDGPVASWIDADDLAEQARMLPGPAYKRLWLNEWCTGAGDALDPADIEAAIDPDQEPFDIQSTSADPDKTYIGGLDLSTSCDHSAFVVLECDPRTQLVKVVVCKSWAPDVTGTVHLPTIEEFIAIAHWRFNFSVVGFDPWNAILMAQRLYSNHGINMFKVTHTGATLGVMANVLLQAFRNRTIRMYRDPQLVRDLGRLMIVEKSYGHKLEAPRDKASGHADRAQALCIALPLAVDAASNPIIQLPPDEYMDFSDVLGPEYNYRPRF